MNSSDCLTVLNILVAFLGVAFAIFAYTEWSSLRDLREQLEKLPRELEQRMEQHMRASHRIIASYSLTSTKDKISLLESTLESCPQAFNGYNALGYKVFDAGVSDKIFGFSAKIIEDIQKILAKKRCFKKELTDIASKIAEERHFPLLIIVDELDRCRPSYAIDLLESIKHLFNVPHVVFLLAVDSTQLLQQVEHTFGLKACLENGKIVRDPRQEYLRKFFDIYYNLPVTDNAIFVENMLGDIPILDGYSNKFSQENINLKFPLKTILTADKRLFSDKHCEHLFSMLKNFLSI